MNKEYKRIGIIGLGKRGVDCLGTKIIEKSDSYHVVISGVYDKYPEQVAAAESYLRELNRKKGISEKIKIYSSYEEMIDDPQIDLVMVTTPQYFHCLPVVYALKKKKLVYCDKPLAHSLEDARAMYDAWKENGKKGVILGFTRRYENSWIRAKEIIDQGLIGEPRMLLLRSVIPFHIYFQWWFGERRYSGGLLNEKSSHHFDVLNWFSNSTPSWISAMGGRTTYVARDGYPDRCINCDRECKYRRDLDSLLDKRDASGKYIGGRGEHYGRILIKDTCVYSPKNDINDHAIVNIEYKNGIKAQLFLNIAGPRCEDEETLEVVGTDGRLRLIRHSAEIDIVYNDSQEHMLISAKDRNHETTHFGADYRLVKDIAEFVHSGREPEVTLEDGYFGTYMAMYASKSIEERKVFNIEGMRIG